MKTNLAFALDPIETDDTVGTDTLDPVALDQLLRLSPSQADSRPRTRTARARRMLVSMQDNHSGIFPAFRVR